MAQRITGMALVAAVGVGALMAATPAKAQDQVVYINSSGGVLDDINRKIHWDPKKETIIDDPEATKMMDRPLRAPWVL